MNLQAAKTNYDREMATKEEAGEEARRNLVKQIRDLETQLEDERKGRNTAQSSARKIETELSEMESQIDAQTKGKDDALRMYKKVQVCAVWYVTRVSLGCAQPSHPVSNSLQHVTVF